MEEIERLEKEANLGPIKKDEEPETTPAEIPGKRKVHIDSDDEEDDQ